MNYVAFSGGCDSTATALVLLAQQVDFELVFADTGAELPETYWFIPRFARQIGKKLTVLSNGTIFQHLANWGFLLPSFQRRWCTSSLKNIPQDRFYKPSDTVYIGIRADEAQRAKLEKSYTVKYPLIAAEIDKKDALTLCKSRKQLNPIYQWRSSCSCFCCPFQRVRDWKGLFEHHPDFFMLAESWEDESKIRAKEKGLTEWGWMKDKPLKYIRLADEGQLSLFPEPEGEPCIICNI